MLLRHFIIITIIVTVIIIIIIIIIIVVVVVIVIVIVIVFIIIIIRKGSGQTSKYDKDVFSPESNCVGCCLSWRTKRLPCY